MDMHLGICIFYCLGFLPLRLAFTGLEDWKESIVFLSTHRWCETSTQGTTGASWGLGLKCALSNIAGKHQAQTVSFKVGHNILNLHFSTKSATQTHKHLGLTSYQLVVHDHS